MRLQNSQGTTDNGRSIHSWGQQMPKTKYNAALPASLDNIPPKRMRKERIALGFCTRCINNLAVGGYAKCQRCIDYSKKSNKNIKAFRVAAGLCSCCGKPKLPGKNGCARKMGYNTKNHYKNKAANTCLYCGEERQLGHAYCAKHVLFNKKRGKARRDENRKLVLEYYSNKQLKCACSGCSENQIEFLTIDHINGGGRKHRETTGKGSGLYRWLVKNNFPAGYRVLCTNCNSCIGAFGYCPHDITAIRPLLSQAKGMRYQRTYKKKIKQKVLDHYGDHCGCCGETIQEFLTVDHINGGGHKHRQSLGKKSLWMWLYQNEFPKGFRILCWKCNAGSHIYGVCPHTKLVLGHQINVV